MQNTYAKPFLHKEFTPRSRPANYPVPDVDDLLFFIQRNYNFNTIVYKTNRNPDGLINLNEPMDVYWINYSDNGKRTELNYIQKKLAYGYHHREIAQGLFEIEFVSYAKRLFLARQEDGRYRVSGLIDGVRAFLKNVYIYAEENGVFPDVKFIEFFGEDAVNGGNVYEKIELV